MQTINLYVAIFKQTKTLSLQLIIMYVYLYSYSVAIATLSTYHTRYIYSVYIYIIYNIAWYHAVISYIILM